MERLTTIRLKTKTREKLKKLGIKGESYEEIVSRLISQNQSGKVEESSPLSEGI